MSFDAERAAIESFFQASWAATAFTSTPVIYDNISVKQPSTDFMYHQILGGDGMQKEIAGTGPVLHRYVGLVQVDILAAIGSGSSQTRKLADAIATIYRRRQLTDSAGGFITFKTPSIRSVGRVSERYRTTVTCPYHRDIRH